MADCDDGDVSMMDVAEVSQSVPETMGSLDPVALPLDCNNFPKSPKMSVEEFGPDSVPPMSTSGFGMPAGKVHVPSPNRAKIEEKAAVEPTEMEREAEPSTPTDILPELSHSVLETLSGLEPVTHPEESEKMSFEEFGPDSVPPMPSSSFGVPASRGGPLSPNKETTDEKTVCSEGSQGVPETAGSLEPASLPQESDNFPKPAQKPFEEFGPDSVPPMASSGFGFPASKVNVPSPEKTESNKKFTEPENKVEPSTAIILPEFEGEEMIGDGELPDLVKVVNGSGNGKDSTPDFEEEERKLMVEEKGGKDVNNICVTLEICITNPFSH